MEEYIGHYSIVSELGRGGMGVVYKAHEESLNRFVALKVLGKHLSEDDSFVERFKREAQSAAALNHPNIVQIYSIDEFDGQHCFAMEYVQGISIQQMIKSQGPLDPVAASRLILQAASGLGAAHGHGIVHRDIKPANLMVDERGLVKITDFGLAFLTAGTTRLTATGTFMGTPGYLSPEQCLDQEVDQRTDIYSLGVTLYEMLTGVTPLSADSPLALLRQIIDVEPKDVGELRPEVPEILRTILRKMMAKKPEDRYADCSALTADLQNWLETTGSARSDLSAAVAARVAVPSLGTGTGPTIRVDSAKMAGKTTNDSSRGDAKRMPGAALIAISLVLVAGAGYAAWQFGAVDAVRDLIAGSGDKTEITAGEITAEGGSDNSGGIVSIDTSALPVMDTPLETGSSANEFAETQDISQDVSQDISLADAQTSNPEALPETTQGSNLDPETAIAAVAVTDTSSVVAQPIFDEQPTNSSNDRTEAHWVPPPTAPVIGTGVALVSIGETLLADTAADYVRQTLEERGIVVFDGLAISGVADLLESGGGAIQKLLQPYARYLVFIRADFTGERELYYLGRSDREFQARLNLETSDLLDGRPIGKGVHASIGYTQLSVEGKVEDLLRPKFGRIAGNLSE